MPFSVLKDPVVQQDEGEMLTKRLYRNRSEGLDACE